MKKLSINEKSFQNVQPEKMRLWNFPYFLHENVNLKGIFIHRSLINVTVSSKSRL